MFAGNTLQNALQTLKVAVVVAHAEKCLTTTHVFKVVF
jgi:hypothetical protein